MADRGISYIHIIGASQHDTFISCHADEARGQAPFSGIADSTLNAVLFFSQSASLMPFA